MSKTSEWYTQPRYIEAARLVMGTIDLDPASCAAANQIVKAKTFYTKEQNGLLQEWYGNVWLNPPYGRSAKMQGMRKSTIGLFVEKLLFHYERGDIEQAVVLVTTEVNAKWFCPLWSYPICFPDHRVNFLLPEKPKHKYSQMFGTCFAYLGPNTERFIEIFSQFGIVAGRLSAAREAPINLKLWMEAV